MCTRARVQSCGPSRRGRPRDVHGRSDARYNNRVRETGPSGPSVLTPLMEVWRRILCKIRQCNV
jgi:hypothetical protein